jgi:hypothetical protein
MDESTDPWPVDGACADVRTSGDARGDEPTAPIRREGTDPSADNDTADASRGGGDDLQYGEYEPL